MDKGKCFELGYIEKSHGLAGDVQIYLDVDYPEDYLELESVFVEINNKLVPFFISTLQQQKAKHFVISLEDVNSIDEANNLKGSKLWLPLDLLPELGNSQFYYHEIVGYKVIDKNLGDLGTVVSVYEGSGQDLLAIDYNGAEVLVPINDQFIYNLNKDEGILELELPEGLVEIYKEKEE